jgi:hypothetical protein
MLAGTDPTLPAAAIMEVAELMPEMGPGDEEKPSAGCVETTEDRWGLTVPFMLRPQGKVFELRGDGTLDAQFW